MMEDAANVEGHGLAVEAVDTTITSMMPYSILELDEACGSSIESSVQVAMASSRECTG
jgi:hypothetical protein